jgi:hypothetical protein
VWETRADRPQGKLVQQSNLLYNAMREGACLTMEQDQPNRVGRRLSAIVAADVAGYSRLMGLDEVGTAAPCVNTGPFPMRWWRSMAVVS